MDLKTFKLAFCEIGSKTLKIDKKFINSMYECLDKLYLDWFHRKSMCDLSKNFSSLKKNYNAAPNVDDSIYLIQSFIIEHKYHILECWSYNTLLNIIDKYVTIIKSVNPNLFETPSKRTHQ